MSRNLCRTNCRTCESKVTICGVPYQMPPETRYCAGMWVADAICSVCEAKYTAWIGPSDDHYGTRQIDLNQVRSHGFYDLSYRSSFDDEPGPEDIPKEPITVFRVVKVGSREVWTQL